MFLISFSVPCTAGFQWNSNTLSCDPCPAGFYQPQNFKESCLECPLGQIAPNPGSTVCESKPPGKNLGNILIFGNSRTQTSKDTCIISKNLLHRLFLDHDIVF